MLKNNSFCKLTSQPPSALSISYISMSCIKLLSLKSGQRLILVKYILCYKSMQICKERKNHGRKEFAILCSMHQMAQIKGCCALQLSNEVVLSLSFIHAPKVHNPNECEDSSMTAVNEIFHLCLIQRLHPLFSDESLSEYHYAVFSSERQWSSHIFCPCICLQDCF